MDEEKQCDLKYPYDFSSHYKLPRTCKECKYHRLCKEPEKYPGHWKDTGKVERHSFYCLTFLYPEDEVIEYFDKLNDWKVRQEILIPLES